MNRLGNPMSAIVPFLFVNISIPYLVNGEEARACETTPVDSMEIIYDTDELMEKRTRNLTKYAAQKETAEKMNSCGHTSHSEDGHSCGGNCDCGGNCGCGSH